MIIEPKLGDSLEVIKPWHSNALSRTTEIGEKFVFSHFYKDNKDKFMLEGFNYYVENFYFRVIPQELSSLSETQQIEALDIINV
jgi:hypothetical protein